MAGTPKRRAKRKQDEATRNALILIPQPEPEAEPTDRFGRPWGKYRPEFVLQAKVLCEEGMTDKELAAFFDVDKQTLYNWRFAHPEFAAAMKIGKEQANDRLERKAFEVAMGYTMTRREMVRVKDNMGNETIQFVEVEVEIPPNEKMLSWLLKNRMPETYKDKTEQATTNTVVHLTLEQAREELRKKLEKYKAGTSGTGQG